MNPTRRQVVDAWCPLGAPSVMLPLGGADFQVALNGVDPNHPTRCGDQQSIVRNSRLPTSVSCRPRGGVPAGFVARRRSRSRFRFQLAVDDRHGHFSGGRTDRSGSKFRREFMHDFLDPRGNALGSLRSRACCLAFTTKSAGMRCDA